MFVRNTSNDLSRCVPRGLALTLLLAGAFAGPAATSSLAAITCKPILSIRNVRELRTAHMPIQPWIWKATIVADNAYCATVAGAFEIDFIRIKEYAPDVQVTEKYNWSAGQFDVAMELTADEAIHDYRVGFIAPCVCRALPFEK
jgi:hypothetical protein